jgi:aldehyde dehydrogenase (NAD+)
VPETNTALTVASDLCTCLLLHQIRSQLVAGFRSGKLKDIAYRKEQIVQLGYLLRDNSKRFEEALAADLGRPALESGLYVAIPSFSRSLDLMNAVLSWSQPLLK